MKKMQRFFLGVCLFCLMAGTLAMDAQASQGTTYTYTISVDGDWIRTQEAYLVSTVLMQDQELSQPNDVFVLGKELYIADTGNRRIVIYDMDAETVREITNEAFVSPMGLFVNEEKIYIADSGAQAVFLCDHSGAILHAITRPEDSPLMSSSSIFKPINVVATEENNLFVVGEGSYDGLMQFSEDGTFQGYFAANKRSLTMLERIQEAVFTREQKEQLLTKKPRAIQNIDISDRGLVYSVTQSTEVSYAWRKAETKTSNALKLHNMAGTNILSTGKFMDDEWNFVDVAAGPYGNSYALTYTGLVYEYDSYGNLIFSFGGRAVSNDRYGLFTYASAIDMDDRGFLYVLDKERGLVQVYTPTDFAVLTHRAIYDLENGNYESSEENWQELLKLNGMSRLAHVGYGKSMLRQQRYSEALKHFKIANDRENYSECFWEIRNVLINKYIVWAVVIVFVLMLLYMAKNMIWGRRKKYYNSYELKELPTGGPARFGADMRYAFSMLRHPVDAIYYLRTGKRGSVLSATALLTLGYLVYMADILGKGFIFDGNSLSGLSPILISLLYIICVILFVAGNYMMAAINEGEGTVRNIIVFLGYSITPYILFSLAGTAMSYVLTLNEAFVIILLQTIGICWSAALVFLSIANTHNYTIRETVKNILLTLVFAILALVLVAILYLVWDKVLGFVSELIAEVKYRAQY